MSHRWSATSPAGTSYFTSYGTSYFTSYLQDLPLTTTDDISSLG